VSVLIVPSLDEDPWPTLGPQVADLIEECAIFGPGSLKGQPARLDPEKRAALYRMYEVYPQEHRLAGRRRFKRCSICWRKGLAKTEFMAWVAFAELHPDAPVRCDGFDADGHPVGRPVVDPYIPMLAVTAEQVEELAYGALYTMTTEGPDADLFDSTNERIIRLSPTGRADGKAVPLSNSPGSRDGARTTFQCFDEPHRLILPRQVDAHETMVANLEKRVLEDPWGLYVGTAGEIGQGSIAEGLQTEARLIESKELVDPQLFHFHREASAGYDLDSLSERIAAVTDATGPAGEYGPGQFESIARQWDRPTADKAYLERVWLNRWVKSGRQAFDTKRWADLGTADLIEHGSFVTWGFDGARYRDATAFVLTDIPTGRQQLWALWEKPLDAGDDWEVPGAEVADALDQIHAVMKVWRGYYDPFHWSETMKTAAGRYSDDVVVEWRTNRTQAMAWAVRRYREAHSAGTCTWSKADPLAEQFGRHIAAAGRSDVNHWDDKGERLFILDKIHPDRKFDAAQAANLSWEARLDALKAGAKPANEYAAMSY
jgi:hypothetical protein